MVLREAAVSRFLPGTRVRVKPGKAHRFYPGRSGTVLSSAWEQLRRTRWYVVRLDGESNRRMRTVLRYRESELEADP